ncbi:hypothetical protein FACS1894190_03780 [Spirochaetia bacterium]|nr:hypothetical protein FACS1894190_03780 [Spirochaetia bacterium]
MFDVALLSGWIVSAIQFFVNRHNQEKDKLIDRKYDTYSSYMKKYITFLSCVCRGCVILTDVHFDIIITIWGKGI